MRTTFFLLLSFLQTILLVFCPSANCQTDSTRARIELKSFVDRSEVPFNRELTFTVEASWEGEQNRFSITPLVPPQCENLEIMGSSSVNQTRMEMGKTISVKTFRFNLKPIQIGAGRIGSVQLSYLDNATQDSSSLSTQAVEVQIIAPVLNRGPKYKIILLIVVAVILAYVIYTAKKRGNRIELDPQQESVKNTLEEESPEQKGLGQLKSISGQVEKGELGSFSSSVYRLLAGYLEERYQIVTAGKTTNDIIHALAHVDISPERIALLKEILSACDLAKFAAERMEKSGCERMLRKAKEFLEQNG